MAGIVGALGKNKDIKGIAPECEFVIVKLSESAYTKKLLNLEIPIFSLPTIFAAIEYLKKVLFKEKKPLVVLLPLGSNNGNHKGDNIFDSFIESVSNNVGIVIVTGSGNEADKDGHVSGRIVDKENIEVIDLLVQENQGYMAVEIWVDLPNIIDINLISPSGEETGFIRGAVNVQKTNITVGLNNSTQVISGTSLAAAIGAGACVLLFQWGIVQGNYPYMYSQSIKTFLRRGVNKRGKDIYPNPQWGYGIINFYKIFEEMI